MQYLLIIFVISVLSSQPIRSELAQTTPVLLSDPQRSILSLSHGTNQDVRIGLEVFGDQITLLLSPNRNLLHHNYVYQHIDSDNKVASQNGLVIPCHYSGTVECVACHNSHASISTCGGQLRGLISYNDTDYYIEPLVGSSKGTHFVYTNVSPDNATQSELLVDSSEWLSKVADSHLRSVRAYALSNNHLFIETLVVLDETMLSHHGTQSDTYALTIMNIVSGLLARPSLGQSISLVVTRLVVSQTGTNTFTWNPSDPDSALSAFCQWQHDTNATNGFPSHDLALLLTRRSLCPPDTFCGVVGVANVAGLCSGTRSCLIVRDQGVMLAGTTVTHEIGHLLGLYHDENPARCGAYNIPPNSYIMTQVFTSTSNHFDWSECSRHSVLDFLSRGGDTCLQNEPTNQIQLSDVSLTADEQCRSSLGANSRAVPHLSTCAALTCSENVTGLRWQSLNTPMLDGTNCSINRIVQGKCRSGICVLRDTSDEPINGGWSQWLEWSHCSHTCDIGERHRERECVAPSPANGGDMCLGDIRQYATCFLSKCATSAPTRRDTACGRVAYEYPGTWTALSDNYRVSDPCGLFCRNENGHLATISSVADGTECHAKTPQSAMCILGNCVEVDCRGELAGGARLDTCGVCGGDDTSCHVVKGIIQVYLPSFNLHKLVSFPQEARDLTILNLTPHPFVYLALTQSSNTRLFRPINSQIINGVAWRCATFSNGSDSCSASGPIYDSLDLKVFGGPTQVALYYSYIMPPDESYVWRPESICSTCNATCGSAYRNCVAECVDETGISASSHLCDSATKPLDTSIPCEGLPDCPKYIWAPSGWSSCSATCGRGVKTRTTPCLIQTELYFQPTDQSNCVAGEQPIRSLPCFTPCLSVAPTTHAPIRTRYAGGWVADRWEKCHSCAQYSQLQVECRIDGQLVDQSNCDPITKPAAQQRECPQECTEWQARPWTSCDTNCRQHRIVRCLKNGMKVRPSVCRNAKMIKPKKSQKCSDCQ